MDKIRALRYFKRVAELHSFTQAAEEFGIPASSISRRIKDLEKMLGIELLQRSTRAVKLTELGAVYYSMIEEGVRVLDDADDLVSQRMDAPSGIIRITAMPTYGELVLSPILEKFTQTYPDIVLDLYYSDDVMTLGKDPFDIAIRGGYAPDERVIAKRLTGHEFKLVATPEFLAALDCATPLSLDTLKSCKTLQYRGPKGLIDWYVMTGDSWEKIDIKPSMICNNGTILSRAALKHQGIVFMPQWGMQPYLDSGKVVEVPTEDIISLNRSRDIGIFLLHLKSRYQIPKIKLCVDFLLSHLGDQESDRYI
ncbi:MAG: LysR family transcriptional regulator [Gammaproteobacteria bacterium]|nr:LysR family transcriptional regulator [Gammaproteobacteria bacterium]